jgi:zinc protease
MIRKIRLLTTASVFLTLCAGPAFPQTTPAPKAAAAKEEALPSADELSAKCAKGSGGKEAWAKIKTMTMTGTIEIPTMNMTGKMDVFAKSPNRLLRVINMADGQFVQKQAFDGQTGWKSDPQSGLKPLEGSELEETKIEAVFDSDVRLKEVHPDLKVTGRAKVGDRDAYTALTHQPGGKIVLMYLDAETGLRIAEDSEGPNPAGQVEKTSAFFEDYRTACGIQTPYRVRVTTPQFSFVLTIKEVRCNEPVDDSMFAMPSADAPTPPKS